MAGASARSSMHAVRAFSCQGLTQRIEWRFGFASICADHLSTQSVPQPLPRQDELARMGRQFFCACMVSNGIGASIVGRSHGRSKEGCAMPLFFGESRAVQPSSCQFVFQGGQRW